jgi:hypothetical protein
MRPVRNEILKPRSIFPIVAIAEEDDPIGFAAVFIVDVPVRRELLERDQQVIAVLGAAAHHRADHRQVKGVDQRDFGPFLEEQERQGLRLLATKSDAFLSTL